MTLLVVIKSECIEGVPCRSRKEPVRYQQQSTPVSGHIGALSLVQ